MATSPKEILSIAKELSDSNSEIKIRTSIGRSYYSAFHLGLGFLEITDTKEWTGGKGGVHEKLIGEFEYNSNREVAYLLSSLKAKRHLADYHLSADIGQEDAKASIVAVESLFQRLK